MTRSRTDDIPAGRDERELVAAARREAEALKQSPAPALSSNAIPGYSIMREIGHGGMGVIYEAQRKDPPQLVALKVMRGKRGADKHRQRLFRREVQTLARLSSPNIAAIYDAGRTNDGRHFLAMELVRGAPLTEYARVNDLTLSARLRLFRRVCEAIHYAHRHGVIHRDLKPSNIIIDGDGNPKILDFGLARISDADEAMRTMFTEAGKVMGTLAYMSPEQAQGRSDDVDIRSDIYSLGVILHELLTEQLPLVMSTTASGEVPLMPPAGSPQLTRAGRRILRGDLGIVIRKTLARDPAQRYQSAAAVAEDIDRFLARQPILARKPSAAYEFRRFVARHAVPSAYVATLLAFAIGLAIWISVLHAEDVERQRQELERTRAVGKMQIDMVQKHRRELRQAEIEREKARQASEFWEQAIASVAPGSPEAAPTIHTILDGAADRALHGPHLQPEVAAALHESLGSAYARHGRLPEAEKEYRVAVSLRLLLTGWSLPVPGPYRPVREKLRRTVFAPAWAQLAVTLESLANLLMREARYSAAEPIWRACLEIRDEGPGGSQWLTAWTRSALGECLARLGRAAEAEPLLVDSFPLVQDGRAEHRERALQALDRIIAFYESNGKPVEAAAWRAQRAALEASAARPP